MAGITALGDERIANYRLVADPERLEARGLFVAEGRLVVERLLSASARPGNPYFGAAESVLVTPAAYARMEPVLQRVAGTPIYVVPQDVMNGLTGFNFHRGCLALARRPPVATLDDVNLGAVARAIVLEGVNNPDNVGGIFRCASALGADLVVLGPACADPLYRKSIRTAMGAVLDVPWVTATRWPGDLDLLRAAGLTVLALTPDSAATPLPSVAPLTRVALLAGAEGSGLSAEAQAAADLAVTIPMTSRGADSLNVTTAMAIALYHVGMGVLA